MEIKKGTILNNRYTIEEKIATGGMSNIYKAHCQRLNRTVAIKILKKEYLDNDEFLRKFKNEALAAGSLNHPNIIGIYDVYQDENISYIVMEYVDGKNLKELIKDGVKFNEREALLILRQVCLALSEAHKYKIVHRDIKSHNIMINNLGMVKVGDFGIAKLSTSNTVIAKDEKVFGSVQYISPEQAKGLTVDKRSDIYSLGIVFYELLTSKVPFDSENPINIAIMHIENEMDFQSDFLNVSKETVNILKKMTMKNRNERYEDVEEIIRDIDNIKSKNIDKALKTKINQEIFNEHVKKFYEVSDKENSKALVENELNGKTRYIEKKEKTSKTNLNKRRKSLNKKRRKSNKIYLLGSICILMIIALGLKLFFFDNMNSKLSIVPNIKGENVEDARKILKEKGLKLKIISYKEDEDYLNDEIISQNPEENIKIRKGETISVIVSKKEIKNIFLEDLTNTKIHEAEEILKEKGLSYTISYEFSDNIEKDYIIREEPNGNQEVNEDENVILYVSKGKDIQEDTVPKLIGLSLEEAKNNLGQFTIGNISYKEDKNNKDNIVLYQNPKEFSKEKVDKKIDIVINKLNSSSNFEKEKDSNKEVETNVKKSITKEITLMLPQGDNMKIFIKDGKTGDVVYSNNISTDGEFKINVTGNEGESKKYDIYINDKYYATTGEVGF